MNRWAKLGISLLLSHSAGFIGSFFTVKAIPGWYATLVKPSFNPPNQVFAPVWLTLYTLMGISLFLIWEKGLDFPGVKKALFIFGIQLVLNAVWSILFFGLHRPLWAFVEIIFMWISILLTIIFFYPISKTAALINVPYLLWVSFASFLNYNIWILNR